MTREDIDEVTDLAIARYPSVRLIWSPWKIQSGWITAPVGLLLAYEMGRAIQRTGKYQYMVTEGRNGAQSYLHVGLVSP